MPCPRAFACPLPVPRATRLSELQAENGVLLEELRRQQVGGAWGRGRGSLVLSPGPCVHFTACLAWALLPAISLRRVRQGCRVHDHYMSEMT